MKTLLLAFFIFLISPNVLFAEAFFSTPFFVNNHTKGFGTAQTGMSPCSSSAGNTGIIKPNAVYKVPEEGLNMFCKSGCQIKVFMNKNCNKKPIGQIKIDRKKGIQKVDDYHRYGYRLSGSGFNLAVEGGRKHRWSDMD